MQLLTIENAEKILESGEIYRLGYNALNSGELFYDHKEVKPFSRTTPRGQVDGINLVGKIKFNRGSDSEDEWLDTINEENPSYSKISGAKMNDHNDDLRMKIGAITLWNGEPLFILDDYEEYQDIANIEINELMLPDIFS